MIDTSKGYDISLDGLSRWPRGRPGPSKHDHDVTMARIKLCVVCDRPLTLPHKHTDTCGERCFRQLLRKQRGLPSRTRPR